MKSHNMYGKTLLGREKLMCASEHRKITVKTYRNVNGNYNSEEWNYEYQMIIKISLCFYEFSKVSAMNRY